MRDEDQTGRLEGDEPSDPLTPEPTAPDDALDNTADSDDEPYDESLTEELSALIDDGRTYAEAELAFQKTRAALAGRKIGGAILFTILALIMLHLALIALSVGIVIALEPLVTIWGAIAIVVGVLLLGVAVFVLKARSNAMRLADLFQDDGP